METNLPSVFIQKVGREGLKIMLVNDHLQNVGIDKGKQQPRRTLLPRKNQGSLQSFALSLSLSCQCCLEGWERTCAEAPRRAPGILVIPWG